MFKLTQKRQMEKYIVIYLVVQRESNLLDFDYFGVIKQKKIFKRFSLLNKIDSFYCKLFFILVVRHIIKHIISLFN